MPQVSNQGVRIAYEVSGHGPALLLMHGWCCDRTWWVHAGYVRDLEQDFRVVNMDLRGHGASDKPHHWSDYRSGLTVGDALAVMDAESHDRFAVWGLSYGGWLGWLTAYAQPDRVSVLVSSGSWDPVPSPDGQDAQEFDDTWGAALRQGGTLGLVALFKEEDGDAYATEFPAWAEATTLQADPEALLAIQARELAHEGVPTVDDFPVPVLLIAGEREDPDDDAARIASRVPHGERLRLPGLGHGGACAASALTLPTARAFLDRHR